LDSNLLILLLLGSFDLRLIASFKRLSDFTASDFHIVRKLSLSFKVATTAHILTEVSNLANQLPRQQKDRIFPYIASRIGYLREDIVAAADVIYSTEFVAFGITDAVLRSLCDTHLVLTNDRVLAAHLRLQNHSILTLDDLRASRLLTGY
jgi:hypothetical protein